MDVTGVTVAANNLLSGYTAIGADGNLVTGTASGPSWTFLTSKEFTVNTSSTSATSVGTISCGSSAYTSGKILYVKIRDKAGAREGYCSGSDNFFFNRLPASSLSTELQYAARFTQSLRSGDEYYTYPSGTNIGYGVYANTVTSAGVVSIYARYHSTYSTTINGTFKCEVYLLDYAPNQGNPYNYSFS